MNNFVLQMGEMVTDHYVPKHFKVIHHEKKVGEIIDGTWIRTPVRVVDSVHEDNYVYAPIRCFCNDTEFDKYTYEDEFGSCDFCRKTCRDIFGHNGEFSFVTISGLIRDYIQEYQTGNVEYPTSEGLTACGILFKMFLDS